MRVDRRKIELAEPIKRIGRYQVPIELFPEVTVEIRVLVVPEGGELPPEEELQAMEEATAARPPPPRPRSRRSAPPPEAAIEEELAPEPERRAAGIRRGRRHREATEDRRPRGRRRGVTRAGLIFHRPSRAVDKITKIPLSARNSAPQAVRYLGMTSDRLGKIVSNVRSLTLQAAALFPRAPRSRRRVSTR